MMIDMKGRSSREAGIDFRKYMIIGACDATQCLQSIMAEENIGLLLPCKCDRLRERSGRCGG